MRGFFDKFAKVFGCMDAAEFIIPSILAAVLLIVAPLVASFFFMRAHHYLAATLSICIWILAVITCVRDFRRRHFSWLGLTLGAVWLVTTLFILWRLETG